MRAARVVGPGDRLTWGDRLWPTRHRRWWHRDVHPAKGKGAEELFARLLVGNEIEATRTLEHVQEIAETATDRAAAADRRATTLAGTVAIAASLTVSGGALILERARFTDTGLRVAFAAVLCATTWFLVASAVYALRALVATRTWSWIDPHSLPTDRKEKEAKQLGMRAAHLLHSFGTNWEISDVKNRTVDKALSCLVIGLVGIGTLATLVLIDVT